MAILEMTTTSELVRRGAQSWAARSCGLLGHLWQPRYYGSAEPVGHVCPRCRSVKTAEESQS